MPAILENPLEHILTLLQSNHTRLVIGLAGLPGSGKTTLTQAWERQVNLREGAGVAKALSMDGFHFTKTQLSQMPDPEKAFARRGAHWTFDGAGFVHKVRALKTAGANQPVYWPAFEHEVGDPVQDAIEVPPACRVALVEGLYLLYREGPWAALEGVLDQIWYLDTPMQTSIDRLVARHRQAWNFSEEQARHRVESSDYKNALLVETTRQRADWLVT